MNAILGCQRRHSDLRRARAGAVNIVPTSTGAAAVCCAPSSSFFGSSSFFQAVALVLPKLKGKLNGIALRVPTPNVSIVDLVVKTSKKTTKDEVNAALKAAAEGSLSGILGYTDLYRLSIVSCFWKVDEGNKKLILCYLYNFENAIEHVFRSCFGDTHYFIDGCFLMRDKGSILLWFIVWVSSTRFHLCLALPLVSSDFQGTDVSATVDSDLTLVMGEDMVKVVMWYDNEWGYSQRVVDLAAVVAGKL